ncbi:MAG: hypothetical protein IJD23_00910 [Spirochaetaceae bacterium]|nr:hypothetical protein [Spirochaetaceae bacterium]
MNEKVKKKEISNEEFALLAYECCTWWNSVIIQYERFIDLEENNDMPWDNPNSIFISERLYLITVIHHAIEYLEKLNHELVKENCVVFEDVIKKIERVTSINDIINLRNMNEHRMDYSLKLGHKQNEFESSILLEKNKYKTNAFISFSRNGCLFFGNVPIKELIEVIKSEIQFIRTQTKEIFNKKYFAFVQEKI